jgi:hypothetical protein
MLIVSLSFRFSLTPGVSLIRDTRQPYLRGFAPTDQAQLRMVLIRTDVPFWFPI